MTKCWIRKIASWRMLRLKKKFFFVDLELELDGYSLVTSGVRRNMWRSSSLLRHLRENHWWCFYVSNKSPTLSSNAMEDNFRSPPSWGQILRSRPLHAGLGGVIHKFETSLVDGHFEKLYTFCCYKFVTNLDGPLEKYIFRNIHLCAQLHFNAVTAKTIC